jgi:predicted nuclease of restriction endonuclease-like (RecB) superfamily
VSDVEPARYAELLAQAKAQIQAARTRAALAVNAELIDLYWRLGRVILERQEDLGWGGKVIDRLSTDLRSEFPSMRGLGRRNLHYMRAFAGAWPDPEIVQRLIAQLPWGHNVELLTGLSERSERCWYAEQALTHGWSRDVLAIQITSRLHLRTGAAVLRSDDEGPTIGLLLCRTRNEIVVRHALSGVATPMAVGGYRLAELPPDAREALPGEDDLLGVVDAAIDDNVGRG